MSTAVGAPTGSRRGLWIGIGVVLAVVVLSALVRVGNDSRDGALDPQNPRPDGARAVARVLEQHGVGVDIVRGQASFLRSDLDADTTVVVSNAWELGPSTLRRLRQHAGAAGGIVLVAPADPVLRALSISRDPAPGGLVSANCDDRLYDDLSIDVRAADGYRASGCFGSRADAEAHLLVRSPEDRDIEVFGADEALANHTVLRGDNAALALRLLGQRHRVVWYVADAADTTAADSVSVRTLLPAWLVPGLWLLAVAFAGFAIWRGRRLGPVVREPMPVVVRAAEATESRGRLYRRTRDRAHAAHALRTASRRRLALALSLPADHAADPTPQAAAPLVLAVARATGRSSDEIGLLLVDGPVATDPALAELGRGLLRLENEVRIR